MHFVLSESPNFIAGTETWLNSDVYSIPLRLSSLLVEREGRYGSVLFACHNTINCTQIPLHIQCEAVVCRISLSGDQMSIILTVYRPPNRNIQCMQNICKVIKYLCIYKT